MRSTNILFFGEGKFIIGEIFELEKYLIFASSEILFRFLLNYKLLKIIYFFPVIVGQAKQIIKGERIYCTTVALWFMCLFLPCSKLKLTHSNLP